MATVDSPAVSGRVAACRARLPLRDLRLRRCRGSPTRILPNVPKQSLGTRRARQRTRERCTKGGLSEVAVRGHVRPRQRGSPTSGVRA